MRPVLATLLLALGLTTGACASPVFVGAMDELSSEPPSTISPGIDPEVPAFDPVLPEPPVPGWPVGEDDVVLRVDVHEGFDRSERVSFAVDGRVVRAADTTVYASVDDYTTWRIDPEGLQRVLRGFDALGVREPGAGGFGDGAVSPDSRTVTLVFPGGQALSGSAPLQVDVRRGTRFERLWTLANQVTDPAWHGGHVMEEVRPWQPARVGVRANQPDGPANELPREWPLDLPVTIMGELAGGGPADEPWEEFCLAGADARQVFAMLTPGQNSAHVLVDDGHQLWDLDVHVELPGYHLGSSPCARVR